MTDVYTTTHNSWDPNLLVPLVVSVPAPDQVQPDQAQPERVEIFRDPVWGVRILKVIADGETVAPENHDVDLDDMDFRTIPVGIGPFIYQVRFLDFHFAATFSAHDYQLVKYALPQTARHIQIQYQLRQSPDAVGPLMTLNSYLLE